MEFLSEFQQFEMVERVDHRNSQISKLSQVRWKGGGCVGLDVDSTFTFFEDHSSVWDFLMWHFPRYKKLPG